MRALVQVKTNGGHLNIRSGSATSFAITGKLNNGDRFYVNGTQSGWYKLENGQGWVSGDYVKVLESDSAAPQTSPTTPPATSSNVNIDINDDMSSSPGLDPNFISMLYKMTKSKLNKVDGSTRLFGCPFQFTNEVDLRVNTELNLGRKYIEHIIAESPILYMIPSKPNYLPDLAGSEKEGLKNFFNSISKSDSNVKTTIDQIINDDNIRYFDIISDYSSYINYTNLLCRICSIYMGIGDNKGPTGDKPYSKYDWSNYKYLNAYSTNKNKNSDSLFDISEVAEDLYDRIFGKFNYVQFYVDPSTSFNESANNNTTQSKIEGFFESAEGIVKELAFFNETMALKGGNEAMGNFASGMNQISDEMFKNTNENFFQRLLGMSSTILTGSNILFPELWGDSSYGKSYNITINLASPYGDKESIYLNIIVPLMHIIALSLPKQTTANSYTSPFMIKAFVKGIFSCEMGIIDSISIDKGGDESWSVDGLPTQVKVQISLKDLYSSLMITSGKQPALFFQNYGLIDFLAVTCGVDVTKPNIQMKIDTMFASFLNRFQDLPSNVYRELVESLRIKLEPLYKLH